MSVRTPPPGAPARGRPPAVARADAFGASIATGDQIPDFIRGIALTTEFAGREVLCGVDVAIPQGSIYVILGASGCGKTTLLRHLCGLLPPTMGAIYVDGRDLYSLSPELLRELRLRTGLAFQGGALLGSLSVLDNVALPLRENTMLPADVIVDIARVKLDMVGLLDAADLLPSSLSGGMRKRAAIARAIALDPDVVYLDEPSAGLDPITAAEIDNVIKKLNSVFGITMVVVTHDIPSAETIADHVLMLASGHALAQGSKEAVWHTSDPHLRDFIARKLPDGDRATALDITEYLAL